MQCPNLSEILDPAVDNSPYNVIASVVSSKVSLKGKPVLHMIISDPSLQNSSVAMTVNNKYNEAKVKKLKKASQASVLPEELTADYHRGLEVLATGVTKIVKDGMVKLVLTLGLKTSTLRYFRDGACIYYFGSLSTQPWRELQPRLKQLSQWGLKRTRSAGEVLTPDEAEWVAMGAPAASQAQGNTAPPQQSTTAVHRPAPYKPLPPTPTEKEEIAFSGIYTLDRWQRSLDLYLHSLFVLVIDVRVPADPDSGYVDVNVVDISRASLQDGVWIRCFSRDLGACPLRYSLMWLTDAELTWTKNNVVDPDMKFQLDAGKIAGFVGFANPFAKVLQQEQVIADVDFTANQGMRLQSTDVLYRIGIGQNLPLASLSPYADKLLKWLQDHLTSQRRTILPIVAQGEYVAPSRPSPRKQGKQPKAPSAAKKKRELNQPLAGPKQKQSKTGEVASPSASASPSPAATAPKITTASRRHKEVDKVCLVPPTWSRDTSFYSYVDSCVGRLALTSLRTLSEMISVDEPLLSNLYRVSAHVIGVWPWPRAGTGSVEVYEEYARAVEVLPRPGYIAFDLLLYDAVDDHLLRVRVPSHSVAGFLNYSLVHIRQRPDEFCEFLRRQFIEAKPHFELGLQPSFDQHTAKPIYCVGKTKAFQKKRT